MLKYWLMKSEPMCFSIDDLKKAKKSPWDGVRNYQARNFMKNDMKEGDLILFYHSNAKPSGVAGVAKVCSKPYPDFTAFDSKEKHYDPKSKEDHPTWIMVDVCFVKKFKNLVTLEELRKERILNDMLLLKKGCRLSVMPIDKKHFDLIENLGSN